ncbi:MAG: hypothetical protein WBG43_11425 [Marinifilaceae bacterium]
MNKKLLLGIINNGIDEIKLLTADFTSTEPSQKHIDITIQKVEILLKELHLLDDGNTEITENIIKEIITPSIEIKKETKQAPIKKHIEEKKTISSYKKPLIEEIKEPVIKKTEQKKAVIIEKEIIPVVEKNNQTVDIRSFIGINDKFLFIRELFDSNIDDYQDFITETNKIESKKEAEKIISAKNWNREEESTKLLTEIINRKFI